MGVNGFLANTLLHGLRGLPCRLRATPERYTTSDIRLEIAASIFGAISRICSFIDLYKSILNPLFNSLLNLLLKSLFHLLLHLWYSVGSEHVIG